VMATTWALLDVIRFEKVKIGHGIKEVNASLRAFARVVEPK
jgi:hypothetical protein